MRSVASISALLVMCGFISACAHHVPPERDPAALARLHADVRMVGGETTWVTHGRGYELVGRTRGDLVAVQPALDRGAAFLARVYPRDSIASLTVTVRHVPAPGKPALGPAPVPSGGSAPVVEAITFDPKAAEAQHARQDGSAGGPGPSPFGNPAMPAIRAWMSARASQLSGTQARPDQLRGELEDPRVPAWMLEMIGVAGNESFIDNATMALAAHMETLIPLSQYFSMPVPSIASSEGRRRGESGGQPGGGSRGGMGRGMGGGMAGGRMGGRGGMGRGGRTGGYPGGEGSRGTGDRPLEGPALFAGESAVLTKYLERVGDDVIGELADAQMRGATVDEAFAKRNMGTVSVVDADWRSWLLERADILRRQ